MVQRGISVLSVHIVGARARVVLDPDAVVLDVASVLLSDLVHVQNLTSGLLHLSHLVHEIPEAGLGNHGVGSEDLHAVGGGVGVGLGGSLAANDLEQLQLFIINIVSIVYYYCCCYC